MDTPLLDVRTVVLIRRLASGELLAAPVCDLPRASLGDEAHALGEQRLFLTEYLARVPPVEVARFALPDGVTLASVDVPLAREKLPRRLATPQPIEVPYAVIPSPAGSWVVVVPLDYVCFVPAGDDVPAAVRSEVERLVAALELAPSRFLELLPAREHRLETMDLGVERAERMPASSAMSLRRALAEREKRRWATEVLGSVGVPLHARVRARRPPPLTAREAASTQLAALLEGRDRLGVLLTGPALAGKSALLEAWVAHRGERDRELRVYATSGAQLIAGMSGLGQWQARMARVIEAAHALDAVLYFDNLGDLLAERADGGVDLAGVLKPALEDGRIRLVAELRDDQLDDAERRHAGLLAALARVRVDPLDAARTRDALLARIAHHARVEPDQPRMLAAAVPTLVELAERYLPYQSFPGKACKLYDDLRTVRERDRRPDGTPAVLDARDVYQSFSLQTGVPVFLLRDDHALRMDEVLARLRTRVVGQDAAVRGVAETVCVVKAGLQPTGKPLATFLFVGPTGVGKTEVARALAEFLFGAPDRMVRFDMSEYADPAASERLIRGTDRAEGLLTRKVREQPFCVLLLDEIEKAHAGVFDLLLQVCGEGRLTDGRGRTAFFHNAIIILTSNLGAASRRPLVGFDASAESAEAHYKREVARTFRPEFVNRLDRIVAFAPLRPDEIAQVARSATARLATRRGFAERGITLRLSDRALAHLARDAYSERYGARALRRHLEDHLVAPIARLLNGPLPQKNPVAVHVTVAPRADDPAGPLDVVDAALPGADALERHHGGLRLAVRCRGASDEQHELHDLEAITATRRRVDRLLALPRVVSVREQLEHLTTQLNYGNAGGGAPDPRVQREVAPLQAEHHRLREAYDAVLRAQAEVHAVEDVALLATLEGSPGSEFRAEGDAAGRAVERAMPRLLMTQQPRRDAITLQLHECDDHGALRRWLAPLLEQLGARGWTATLHADGDDAPTDVAWPGGRRWGPPRDAGWMLNALADPDRSFRNVLLRCEGADAGVFLALEVGLHRWEPGATGKDPDHLWIRLAQLGHALSDNDWLSPALVPMGPAQDAELIRAVPTRGYDGGAERYTVGQRDTRVRLAERAYWAEFERIALAHLLHYERDDAEDRDPLFVGPLDLLRPFTPARGAGR